MQSKEELLSILKRIDHRSYPAYRDTVGSYDFKEYILKIVHVQSDPFASPSDVAIVVKHPGFPRKYLEDKTCRVALQDALLRMFAKALEKKDRTKKASGKSGQVRLSRPGQEVLERTACTISANGEELVLKMNIGFPANGRKITSGILIQILFDQLPLLVRHNLIYENMSSEQKEKLQKVYELTCNQQAIRKAMEEKGLAAFIANGSRLPRKSGASDLVMEDAIPFESTEDLEVAIPVPFGDEIRGMGIPEGIILIVGGGYHGKSTLLEALEKGIYNHIENDGREYVLTRQDAAKIRAEDGRCVHQEDISMFIRNLPNEKDTKCFVSEDASGSTSQAANVVEALESGSKLLLIDEDTSATNFMVRDALMAQVVAKDKEPILPYISRISPLSEDHKVSTILVAGSCGAFFDKADLILQMDQYEPKNITAFAKEKAREYLEDHVADEADFEMPSCRIPLKNRNMEMDRIKVKTSGLDGVSIAKEPVDTRYLEQLADPEQLAAIGKMWVYAQKELVDGVKSLDEICDQLLEEAEQKGLSAFGKGNLAMPRKQEMMGVINRWRSCAFRQESK